MTKTTTKRTAQPSPRCPECGQRLLRWDGKAWVCRNCTGFWPVRPLPVSNAARAA